MKELCLDSGKYERHNEQQRQNLLQAAENLALANGIDALTMKDIAKESGVTRATLYRFFKTKEEILWEINSEVSREIGGVLAGFKGNTFARFSRYAEVMLDVYLKDRRSMLFLDIFFKQYENSSLGRSAKEAPQNPQGPYQTGSTVEYLCRDFFDGSVREDLDPVQAAVSFSYGLTGIILFCAKAHGSIEKKYGLHSYKVAQSCAQALLRDIRPVCERQ